MYYPQAIPPPAPLRRLSACWILSVTLLGCQPAESESQAERTPFHLSTDYALTPPILDLLRVEPAPDNLVNLDFLAVRGCALQSTIIRRNSSLGRTARPAQQLVLAMEFLRRAPACISRLRNVSERSLSTDLEHEIRRQKARLPSLIYNATLGGEEYRSLWLAVPAAGAYPRVDTRVSLAALEALNQQVGQWLEGDYQVDNRTFEIMLSEVAGGDGGSLLLALTHNSEYLHTVNHGLDIQMKGSPFCTADFRSTAANTLKAIVDRYFTGTMQPETTLIATRYRAVVAPIKTLEALLAPVLPAAYRQWKNTRDQAFELAMAPPRQHAHWPGTIAQPCMPKGSKIRYTGRLTQ
jgi:hypothetical protein